MRNGMSLHPLSLPVEVMQTMQLYQTGINWDIGNALLPSNQGRNPYSRNEEISFSSKCSLPSSKRITHSAMNIAYSETTLYGIGQQIEPCYGNSDLSTSSKDICRDATTNEQFDDLLSLGKALQVTFIVHITSQDSKFNPWITSYDHLLSAIKKKKKVGTL